MQPDDFDEFDGVEGDPDADGAFLGVQAYDFDGRSPEEEPPLINEPPHERSEAEKDDLRAVSLVGRRPDRT